jgi:hypothetical protein
MDNGDEEKPEKKPGDWSIVIKRKDGKKKQNKK